jgi:integrase
VLWGWIASNPAANATPPRVPKNELSPPNPDQVGELLRAANELDAEFGRFVHVAATTGARRGELCALRWNCIDFELKTLSIGRSFAEVKGGLIEKDTKTHASRRISLDKDTIAVLRDQRAAMRRACDFSSGQY